MARENFLFGLRLREQRLRIGLSQQKMADIVGRQRTSVVEYEKGQIPSVEVLEKLVDTLGVSADYLLGRTDTPHLPAKGGENVDTERERFLLQEIGRTQALVGALVELLQRQHVILPTDFNRMIRKHRAGVAQRLDMSADEIETASEERDESVPPGR